MHKKIVANNGCGSINLVAMIVSVSSFALIFVRENIEKLPGICRKSKLVTAATNKRSSELICEN